MMVDPETRRAQSIRYVWFIFIRSWL